MTEKDISRWHDTITPQEKGKPWVLGSGGSWDLKDVQPIPDEMLAELAQRYHYAGTPWNCRSMPLTPSDREYMYLIYYSMQGLVARLRIAEQKVVESIAAPAVATVFCADCERDVSGHCGSEIRCGYAAAKAVANAANSDALPPLPEPSIEGTLYSPSLKICYLAPVHFTTDQMQAYARAAIAAQTKPAVMLTDEQVKAAAMLAWPDLPADWWDRKGAVRSAVDVFAKVILAHAAPNAQLVEALREITNDYAERFDLDSPSTNPGIKNCIKQARAALASLPPQKEAL